MKYALLLVCLLGVSCKKAETNKPVQNRVVTDDRFFFKPIAFPSGNVTNEQRITFAQDLEAALDETKSGFTEIAIRAEAPDKDVIALYASNVTRQRCESLIASRIIQEATTIGFRTFSCQDRSMKYFVSIPIKDRKGEVRIGP